MLLRVWLWPNSLHPLHVLIKALNDLSGQCPSSLILHHSPPHNIYSGLIDIHSSPVSTSYSASFPLCPCYSFLLNCLRTFPDSPLFLLPTLNFLSLQSPFHTLSIVKALSSFNSIHLRITAVTTAASSRVPEHPENNSIIVFAIFLKVSILHSCLIH